MEKVHHRSPAVYRWVGQTLTEDRPRIGPSEGNLNIGELDVTDVPEKEPAGWDVAEHVRIRPGIVTNRFWRLERRHFFRAGTYAFQIDIVDFDVFDCMTGNAADDSAPH